MASRGWLVGIRVASRRLRSHTVVSLRGLSSGMPDAKQTTTLDILKDASLSGQRVHFVLETDRMSYAATHMITNRVGSVMVKDANDRVVGFLTQRDILRCIVHKGRPVPGTAEPMGWNVMVGSVMAQAKDLVYLSPEDTLEDARALVSVSGKRHIPVLSGSTVLGVISPKDIARALHHASAEAQEQSAKTTYVSTVMGRRGIPLGTRLQTSGDQLYQNFALRSAVCSLSHPHKASAGEDAFLLGPHMVGVADGVGSWWEGGIDPAVYARSLMHASLLQCAKHHTDQQFAQRLPSKVLDEAWSMLRRQRVIGSSTACLVALDPFKAELMAANVGDSGFLLLRRHRAKEVGEMMGSLDAYPSDAKRCGQFHVAFRSPQQLRGFNAPFQAPTPPPPLRPPRVHVPPPALHPCLVPNVDAFTTA